MNKVFKWKGAKKREEKIQFSQKPFFFTIQTPFFFVYVCVPIVVGVSKVRGSLRK